MKKLFLLLSLVLTFSVQAQYMYPVYWDTTVVLNDICFVNDSTGWAVGTKGKLVYTDSYGYEWSKIQSPVTTELRSIFFRTEEEGYIAGKNGVVLKTINGGDSWTSLTTGSTNELFSIKFFDADTGYASGDNGTVLRTIDGGNNWQSFSLPVSDTILTVSNLQNGHHLFVGTKKNGVYQSTDAGANWSPIAIEVIPMSDPLKCVTRIHNYYPDVIYVHGHENLTYIVKSIDQGASWTLVTMDGTNTIGASHFLNSQEGYVVGSSSTKEIKHIVNGTYSGERFWPDPEWGEAPYPTYNDHNGYACWSTGDIFYTISNYGVLQPKSSMQPYTDPFPEYMIYKSNWEHLHSQNIVYPIFSLSSHLPYTLGASPKKYFNSIELFLVDEFNNLSRLDSIRTTSEGLSSLHTTEEEVYIRCTLNEDEFADHVPVYNGDAFTINEADPISFADTNFVMTLYKPIPFDQNYLSGSDVISGIVYDARSGTPDNPMPDLILILVSPNGTPVARTITDANGEFSFENLQTTTYKLYVDYPGKDNNLAPGINTSGVRTTGSTNLEFSLLAGRLVSGRTTAVHNTYATISNIKIFPSPSFDNDVNVEFNMIRSGKVHLEVYNTLGKVIYTKVSDEPVGAVRTFIPAEFFPTSGLYFIKISSEGQYNISKVDFQIK